MNLMGSTILQQNVPVEEGYHVKKSDHFPGESGAGTLEIYRRLTWPVQPRGAKDLQGSPS